jgi:hypothetical protein
MNQLRQPLIALWDAGAAPPNGRWSADHRAEVLLSVASRPRGGAFFTYLSNQRSSS